MVGFSLCDLSNNSWRQILLSERPPLCYLDHVEKELKRQELRYGTPKSLFLITFTRTCCAMENI